MIHEMMQPTDNAYAGTIRYQKLCVGKVRWFFIDPATIHVPPIPEPSTRTSSPFDPHLCCLNHHSFKWLIPWLLYGYYTANNG